MTFTEQQKREAMERAQTNTYTSLDPMRDVHILAHFLREAEADLENSVSETTAGALVDRAVKAENALERARACSCESLASPLLRRAEKAEAEKDVLEQEAKRAEDHLAAIEHSRAEGWSEANRMMELFRKADSRLKTLEEENARMRKGLESISKNTCCGSCQEARLVALAALKQEAE